MDPNKLSFDLKEMLKNPEAMRNFQNIIQNTLVNTASSTNNSEKKEKSSKEELHRRLNEKIRQQSMSRQSKDIKMAEQMKVIKNTTNLMPNGIDSMDINKVVSEMTQDKRQKKMVKKEMEKYIEKQKEEKK